MDDGYYSGIAPGYERLHGAEQDRKLLALLARVSLRANASVLDVGCATGRSAQFLPEQQWHGIEPAEGLITHAAPEARARILKGSAESLPFPEGSFDAILCVTVLQNVADPASALREMRRVSKPGAAILLSFLKHSAKAEALDRLIRSSFHIVDAWEEQHDRMYVCSL